MEQLAKRIPDDVLENFPPLVVFAPSAAKLGELKRFGLGDRFLIYLSPRLEALSQEEVDLTVAHEFAHVALGHYKPIVGTNPPDAVWEKHKDAPIEKDTDRLTESWGFDLRLPPGNGLLGECVHEACLGEQPPHRKRERLLPRLADPAARSNIGRVKLPIVGPQLCENTALNETSHTILRAMRFNCMAVESRCSVYWRNIPIALTRSACYRLGYLRYAN